MSYSSRDTRVENFLLSPLRTINASFDRDNLALNLKDILIAYDLLQGRLVLVLTHLEKAKRAKSGDTVKTMAVNQGKIHLLEGVQEERVDIMGKDYPPSLHTLRKYSTQLAIAFLRETHSATTFPDQTKGPSTSPISSFFRSQSILPHQPSQEQYLLEVDQYPTNRNSRENTFKEELEKDRLETISAACISVLKLISLIFGSEPLVSLFTGKC